MAGSAGFWGGYVKLALRFAGGGGGGGAEAALGQSAAPAGPAGEAAASAAGGCGWEGNRLGGWFGRSVGHNVLPLRMWPLISESIFKFHAAVLFLQLPLGCWATGLEMELPE